MQWGFLRTAVNGLVFSMALLCGAVGAGAAWAEEGGTMSNDGEHKHTNRLIDETSPYLLQHAHNPVNWYPWGEEALSKAKGEQKPIFLSIGYSACHWCHVMERESFENEAVGAFLNEHFVSIKVDREERPDLDDIYMTAVTSLTGSGGWPMSVFLTPELKPFYGGTYFPPADAYGRPGFMTVLNSIASAWAEKRGQIEQSANEITDHLTRAMSTRAAQGGELTPELTRNAAEHLKGQFDSRHGGWGGAPKFPSSGSIEVLLREYHHTQDRDLLRMATFTLDQMAYGGMYDQLGGGFHRYSVDEEWLVPHFEKMLYDNAQLAVAYTEAWQLTGKPLYRRIVREILDYEIRDMQDPLGGFHSTEDADSEGEEGKFYVWEKKEILDTLGAEAGELFCTYYAVREDGNFSSHEPYHQGKNILHVPEPPEDVAKTLDLTLDELEEKMAPLRQKLMALREQRVHPGLDDKILTSWNALLISALSRAAQVFDENRYRDAAVRAGGFLLEHMVRDGGLLRTHRHGESRLPGYLDDYAFTVSAFADLYEATFDVKWLDAASQFADEMFARFWDEDAGNFYFTSATHKNLLVRTKPTYDGAEPSGNSVAAMGLQRLAKLTGKPAYQRRAERVLESSYSLMARAPQGFLKMLCAVDFQVHPPKEVAIAGKPGSDEVAVLLTALHSRFLPNKVVALTDPDNGADALGERIPLLASKTKVDGKAAAYVCKDYTCCLPVTAPEALLKQLGAGAVP